MIAFVNTYSFVEKHSQDQQYVYSDEGIFGLCVVKWQVHLEKKIEDLGSKRWW